MSWFSDKYGKDARPKMPAELFGQVYDLFHGDEDSIHDVVERVEDGRMSVEDVRRNLARPDIDPEDWQDFEDGWRPSNW